MKVFDRVNVRFERRGDNVVISLPIEYESLDGFEALLEAGTEGDAFVFRITPSIESAVRETVATLWKAIRSLFAKISDVGESPPWEDIEIVWQAPHAYETKVPISAEEVLGHLYMRRSADIEDVRKSIHDTFTKLCELASRRLGFKDRLFSTAFGDGISNKFALISCTYGVYDVLCEIINEEFARVCDEKFWHLDSKKAQDAALAAFLKVKYLEEHPAEFEMERARIQKKWGFPLK